MHIGYFSSIIGTTGGPAIFDKRAIEAIAKLDRSNNYTVYGLTADAVRDVRIGNSNFTKQTIKPSGKWLGIAFGLTLELQRRPVDVLHATLVPPPVVPGKFILTMSCWSQFAQPEVYPPLIRWRLQFLLNRGIRQASAFFCYTAYLKERLIEEYSIPEERVFITPAGLGDEMRVQDPSEVQGYLEREGITGPYILFIGTLTRRKNVHRLLRAYQLLREESGLPHKLVLVGESGYYSQEIFRTMDKLKLANDVILAGRRPHEALPYFYNGADLFVFPTISEGFGLPPLEAMACGTPVVASQVTSVPEVVGDAAVYFDPRKPVDMADAIEKVLSNDSVRAELIARGLKRARRFTWERTARDMVSAYEAVYKYLI